MSKKFMSGTEMFLYECMMQQTPNMARCEREEKRFKEFDKIEEELGFKKGGKENDKIVQK